MRFNSIAAVIFATLSLTGTALAQNGALVPAEAPPAGYSGNQYSDSRGCLFIRASFDGRVTWVPRFDENRQPICNSPTPVSAPAPVSAPPAMPMPVASAPVSAPAIAPQRITPTVSMAQPAAATPAAATALMATAPRRAGTPRRAAPSRLPAGHHAACPASSPFGELVRRPTGEVAVRCVISADLMLAPVGGTAPLVTPPVVAPPAPAPAPAPATPTTPTPHLSGSFVQIATFAVPQNAMRTQTALQARGLPVRLHPARTRGQHMQIVLAGPFFDATSAQTAMQTARRMGFADAFIRR